MSYRHFGFRPLREDRGAAPVFALPPGNYVIHVGFGLASATRTIQLRADGAREIFDIPAGGLRINGRVGDARIPPGQVWFDLFPGSQFDPADRRPIVQSVAANDVILVPEGTYTVTTEQGFCASVDGSAVSGCSRSATVSVPGSHSVDFRPEKEGVIKGTVKDDKGKGIRNATVSAVGKMGLSVTTDGEGAYTMTLAAGSYRVTAAGAGWGHGVGLCQWGAVGRARAGQDFRHILETYFPGTTIERLY